MTRLAPSATLAGRRRRQNLELALREELPAVRAAAVGWRNGLAGLLAALLSFSVIRGRSDIGELDRAWAVAVGGLLMLAALAAGAGALSLLHAAHGQPTSIPRVELLPRPLARHREAERAAAQLRRGIVLTLVCAGALLAAAATTWYGPGTDGLRLRVVTPTITVCGQVADTSGGLITLEIDDDSERSVPLDQVRELQPVRSCPKP